MSPGNQGNAAQAKPGGHERGTKDVVEAEEQYSSIAGRLHNYHKYICQRRDESHWERYAPVELVQAMTLYVLAQHDSGKKPCHYHIDAWIE